MSTASQTYRIAVLPGDGIGPEVVTEGLRVLSTAAERFGFRIETSEYAIGGAAIDRGLDVLPADTLEACLASDAVFLGAVGGPAWDHVRPEQRPERALLDLRKALGVYVNLRPVVVTGSLHNSSPLRSERVEGVDLVVVRELTGGIYFGSSYQKRESDGSVYEAGNTMCYTRTEVERVARKAFEIASRRRGRVTSVDKANVLAVSRLWRDVVTEVHSRDFPEIDLDHLYVDNAAMQLVRDPRQFDVLLTGNLFGDILSDISATLPGSLGLLPSASVGGRTGLFEPVHGSAPDIAGQGKANPIAAILSVAMMLDECEQNDAASAIRSAVAEALASGIRTPDLLVEGCSVVTTQEMGRAVAGLAAGEQSKGNGFLAEQLYSQL